METIKSYLESMFGGLPNTAEVLRAKDELYQMMEDKYNELRAQGISENAAVGQVIADFGNLDEVAETLGIRSAVEHQAAPGRYVSTDEAQQFLNDRMHSARLSAFATFLAINCADGFILLGAFEELADYWSGFVFHEGPVLAAAMLFLGISLAIMITLYILSGALEKKWSFLKNERCTLDLATVTAIKEERDERRITNVLLRTTGIILCALCWLPLVITAVLTEGRGDFAVVVMVIILLVLVGLGVMLIMVSSLSDHAYKQLLHLNDRGTVRGSYVTEEEIEYKNPDIAVWMRSYWRIVTAIYLAFSFVTMSWGISWLIWPIAAIVKRVIEDRYGKTQ